MASNLHKDNISNGTTVLKIQAPQDMMAWMQYVCNGGYEHLKTSKHQGKMKLHEILSKFHVGHDQIGATVRKLRAKQEITTICQNQPHSFFYTPQLRATQLQSTQPRHDTKEGKKHYNKQLTTTSMAWWIIRERSHKMTSHTLFQTLWK